MPYTKKWIEKKKILEEDTNKFKRPRLKSLEGMICIILFITTISFVLGLQTLLNIENTDLPFIIPGLLSIVIIAFVYLIDDILNISSRLLKFFLLFPALIPIISINFDSTIIIIPFFGPVDIMFFYPFLVIPLAVIITSLAINSLKKFPKFTLNNSLAIALTLFICSWLSQSFTGMVIFACLLGLFLVLRNYFDINKRISLGKVGRYSFGAIFAIGAIIANIKFALAILLIPYLVYFILKKTTKMKIIRDEKNRIISISINKKIISIELFFRYLYYLEIICGFFAIALQVQRANFF